MTIFKIKAFRVVISHPVPIQKVHTIHEFFFGVLPGYKMIEVPSQVIHLPVTVINIETLKVRIVIKIETW